MRILLKDLQPSTIYFAQLRSVSESGGVSDWSRLFELITTNETTPPMPPTNLGGVMSEGNLSISWTAPTLSADGTALEDLKDYVVTIKPNPVDPEWRDVVFPSEGTRAEFTKEDNVAAFGRYRPGLTVQVRARDVLGNLSDPATKDFVKPRPQPVSGLTWAAVGNAFSGSWTPPSQNTDLSPFSDPDGFKVTLVYATTNRKDYFVEGSRFDFSFEQNKAAFGGVNQTAKSPITIEVRARDSVGQLSDPVSLEAGNTPPAKPTGVVGTPVIDGIRVVWNANPDTDLQAYEIWSAGTAIAAGTLFGRVSPSDREYIHQTVAYAQDHFLYVTAIDVFESRSPESDRSGPHRPKSPFTVDTTPPGASTLTTATPTRAVSEQAAVTLNWTKPADADLAGYQIRYSENVTPRVWQYVDVADKDALTTTIQGLRSNSIYYFQLRPYDSMINTNAWPVEVAGTSSVSNIAPVELSSDIKVITGGTLRSADYVSGGTTGWLLQSSGLDILGGSVNARVVKAGELRSNVLVATGLPDAGTPLWSLNLDGNMVVRNAMVKGKIVVGNATGGTANDLAIASASYGGTGSQWAIKGDGTIDLKAGGTGANSLQITNSGIRGFDAAGVERITLNTTGQFTLATTNGGVRFDDNGIYGYSGATNTFYVNRNGAAYFAGQVSAASGLIGGWNIVSNSLYAGSLNLRSDLGMIYGGDGANRVAMRSVEGFWAGADGWAAAPFRVSPAGALTAVSGQIGGWTINGSSLYNGTVTLNAATSVISGGTLQGVTVQGSSLTTAYSGQRILIGGATGANNYIQWHNVNGAVITSIYNSGDNMYLNGNWYMEGVRSAGSFSFEGRFVGSNVYLESNGNTYINGGQVYLGNSTNRPFMPNFGYVENTGHGHAFQTSGTQLTLSGYLHSDSTVNGVGGLYGGGQYVAGSTGAPVLYHAGAGTRVGVPAGNIIYMQRNDGGAYASVYGGAYTNQSSIESKKDISRLQKHRGSQGKGKEKVKRLSPVAFAYNDEYCDLSDNTGKQRLGLIAEEVEQIYPEAINRDEAGRPGIDYSVITTALLLTVQELVDEVADLKAQLPAKP